MSTAPSRRRSARAPRLREQARALWRRAILDAAEEEFAERGFVAARVSDIAVRAGLAVGTIYNYFEQKEDVLFALLDERMAAFLEAFEPAADEPSDFRARLLGDIGRLVEFVDSHRPLFQLASEHGLFGGTSTTAKAMLGGRPVPYAKRIEGAFLRLVEQGLSERALAPWPKELLALQLRHSVRSASQWMRATPDVVPDEAARAAVDLFLAGAARAPRQTSRTSQTRKGRTARRRRT